MTIKICQTDKEINKIRNLRKVNFSIFNFNERKNINFKNKTKSLINLSVH